MPSSRKLTKGSMILPMYSSGMPQPSSLIEMISQSRATVKGLRMEMNRLLIFSFSGSFSARMVMAIVPPSGMALKLFKKIFMKIWRIWDGSASNSGTDGGKSRTKR